MPLIAEIKVIGEEVWCKIILERSTDVCGVISLYTPAEIEDIKYQEIRNFHIWQRDQYIEAMK